MVLSMLIRRLADGWFEDCWKFFRCCGRLLRFGSFSEECKCSAGSARMCRLFREEADDETSILEAVASTTAF